jgi:hypothetical protein
MDAMDENANVNSVLIDKDIGEYNGRNIAMDGLPRIADGPSTKNKLILSSIYIACYDLLPRKTNIKKNNHLGVLQKMAEWKEVDTELYKKLRMAFARHSEGLEIVNAIEDRNNKSVEDGAESDYFVYDNINIDVVETKNKTMDAKSITDTMSTSIENDYKISLEYIFANHIISFRENYYMKM